MLIAFIFVNRYRTFLTDVFYVIYAAFFLEWILRKMRIRLS